MKKTGFRLLRSLQTSPLYAGPLAEKGRNTAVEVVRGLVAHQCARIRSAVVRDGHSPIRGHHIHVKVDQSLAAHVSVAASHAVCRVAGGTGEAGVEVAGVLIPTGVLDDLAGQIMALSAHAVGPIHSQIRIGEEISNPLPRSGGLAEFIAALQNVRPFRSMRTTWPLASELAIVVAIVAIRAENLRTH